MVGVQLVFALNWFTHQANTSANGALTSVHLHLASAAPSDSHGSSVTTLWCCREPIVCQCDWLLSVSTNAAATPPFTQKVICLAI